MRWKGLCNRLALFFLQNYMYYTAVQNQRKVTASLINPFKPEFEFVISIHYKPRIAVAIPDL